MAETTSGGSVSISVKPDAGGFGNALSQQLKETVGGVGESLGSTIMSGLKMFAGPILAVTAGLGVKNIIDESIQSFEDLSGSVRSLQRITGGTTQEVSGLRGAMQLAGVNADDTTNMFRILSKQLEAAQGDTKKTKELTALLGTSFLDASGNMKPMNVLLPEIANKFASMPNGIEKTALATQIFGRSGTDLIPVLNKGASGIQELTKQAANMGLVLDDASINKFADAKKASREWDATIQGLQVTIGAALLPVVESFSRTVQSWLIPMIQNASKFISAHREEFELLGTRIQEGVKPVLDTIGGVFKDLAPKVMGMAVPIKEIGDAFSPIKQFLIDEILPKIPVAVEKFKDLAGGFSDLLSNGLREIAPKLQDMANALGDILSGALDRAIPLVKDLAHWLGDNKQLVLDIIAAYVGWQVIQGIIQGVQVAVGIYNGIVAAAALATYGWVGATYAKTAADKLLVLSIALFNGTLLPSLIGSVVAAAGVFWGWAVAVWAALAPFLPLILAIGAVIAVIVFLAFNWEAVFKSVTDIWNGFVGWISDGLKAFSEWWNGAWAGICDFFNKAIAGAIDWVRNNWGIILTLFTGPLGLVIQWIVNNWSGITEFFGNLFNGIGDIVSGVFGNVVNWIKSAINNVIDIVNGALDGLNGLGNIIRDVTGGAIDVNFNHIPHLAEGGVVNRPTIALIGEAGPEAVVPLSKMNQVMPKGADGSSYGPSVIYNAAPNTSINAEADLIVAMRRAKLVAGW